MTIMNQIEKALDDGFNYLVNADAYHQLKRETVNVSKIEEALKLVEDENIHIGERYYVLTKVFKKLIDKAKQ